MATVEELKALLAKLQESAEAEQTQQETYEDATAAAEAATHQAAVEGQKWEVARATFRDALAEVVALVEKLN